MSDTGPPTTTTTVTNPISLAAGAMERYCDDLGIPMPSPGLAVALATVAAPHIAAAERERITELFGEWIEFCLGEIDGPHHPADAWRAGFASLVDPDHPGKIAEPTP